MCRRFHCSKTFVALPDKLDQPDSMNEVLPLVNQDRMGSFLLLSAAKTLQSRLTTFLHVYTSVSRTCHNMGASATLS